MIHHIKTGKTKSSKRSLDVSNDEILQSLDNSYHQSRLSYISNKTTKKKKQRRKTLAAIGAIKMPNETQPENLLPKRTHTFKFNKKRRLTYKKKKNKKNFKRFNPMYIFGLIDQEIKKTKSQFFYIKIKQVEIAICIFCILSVFIVLFENELHSLRIEKYFWNNMTYSNNSSNDTYVDNNINENDNFNYTYYNNIQSITISSKENFLRYLNLFVSISLVISLLIKYKLKLDQSSYLNKLLKYQTPIKEYSIQELIIDILIACIVYPPKLQSFFFYENNTTYQIYNLNSIFAFLHISKLYIMRYGLKYISIFGSEISRTISYSQRVKPNNATIMRYLLQSDPLKTYALVFILFYIIISMLTHLIEITSVNKSITISQGNKMYLLNSSLLLLGNNFWLIASSMLGLGYGDCFPNTFIGRLIVILCKLIGSVFIAYAVWYLSRYVVFTDEESKAYSKLKVMLSKENKEKKAINVIKMILYLRRFAKKKKDYIINQYINSEEALSSESMVNSVEKELMKEQFSVFFLLKFYVLRLDNDHSISSCLDIPGESFLESMAEESNEQCNQLTSVLKELRTLENDFSTIAETQMNLKSKIDCIMNKQKTVFGYLQKRFNSLYKEEQIKKGSKERFYGLQALRNEMKNNVRTLKRNHISNKNITKDLFMGFGSFMKNKYFNNENDEFSFEHPNNVQPVISASVKNVIQY